MPSNRIWWCSFGVLSTCLACATVRPEWRQAGTTPEQLRADIQECQRYHQMMTERGPFPSALGASPVDDPGSADFDLCMERKGWRRGDAAEPAAPRDDAPGPEQSPGGILL